MPKLLNKTDLSLEAIFTLTNTPISLFIATIYAKSFNPGDYGFLELCLSIQAIFSLFACTYACSTITKSSLLGLDSYFQFKLSQAIKISVSVSVFSSFICILNHFLDFFPAPMTSQIFFLISINPTFALLGTFSDSFLTGKKKFKYLRIISFSRNLITLVLVGCSAQLRWLSIEYVLIVNIVTNFVSGFISYMNVKREYFQKSKKENNYVSDFSELEQQSQRQIVSSIFDRLYKSADTYFISLFGLEILGFYGIATLLGKKLFSLVKVFCTIPSVRLCDTDVRSSIKTLNEQYTNLFVFGTLISILCFLFSLSYIYMILGGISRFTLAASLAVSIPLIPSILIFFVQSFDTYRLTAKVTQYSSIIKLTFFVIISIALLPILTEYSVIFAYVSVELGSNISQIMLFFSNQSITRCRQPYP